MKLSVFLALLFAHVLSCAQQGFDFRSTASFVTDPAGDTAVLPTTAYPTPGNGVTFGWVNTYLVQGRDRSTLVDPRLAGINFATNGSPATFYVDLPSAGTYNLSLALGDNGYESCWIGCQIQFLDGTTVLDTVMVGDFQEGFFYDAKRNIRSSVTWPTSNLSQQVTLTGTRLTVVVGTSKTTGDSTPIAFLGITPVSAPNLSLASTFTIKQGTQTSYVVNLTTANGFNAPVAMSAVNVPNGVTVTFNPKIVPAPGAGSTTMTIAVASNTAPGFYPMVVLGDGGTLEQTAPVALTVTK